MSAERLAARVEILLGSAEILTATAYAGIYRGGEDHFQDFIKYTEGKFDVFSSFFRAAIDVGIPAPIVLGGIVVVSTALIVDGFRRLAKASKNM